MHGPLIYGPLNREADKCFHLKCVYLFFLGDIHKLIDTEIYLLFVINKNIFFLAVPSKLLNVIKVGYLSLKVQ